MHFGVGIGGRISILALVFLISCKDGRDVINIEGLKNGVEVIRDRWGVNHIYAKNQQDLFFAQGYCAAKDRLFQFEMWRRQATGTMSEILGEKELMRDFGARLFKYRGDLTTELKHYHPAGVEIINAFTDGVNAYIREVISKPEQLPVEFRLLGIQPGLWTPEVVISRHQGILTNLSQELNIGRAVELRGSAMVKELMWFHPKDPDIDPDSTLKTSLLDKDIIGPYTAMKKELVFSNEELDNTTGIPNSGAQDGSNNWIIGPKKSASGFPMLANDPHRKIGIPSLRYLVHLVAPGWNVTGAGEPAIPGVSIGHNEYGSWGLTIFETDNEDLYVYDTDPGDPSKYFYKGRWVKMTEIADTIPIKNAPSRIVKLRYTVHGPVTYYDSIEHKLFAVRAGWLEPGGAPYLSSLRTDQARNWIEFRDACGYGNMPAENMVWADREGNTGWQVVGLVPIRNNFSGYTPVPGDGRYEWNGYLPIKERPHLLNPKQGFFATANDQVTPDYYSHWNAIGYTWADPYRANRIKQVLSRSEKISIDDMASLQHDKFSMPATELIPLLKNIVFPDAETEKARHLLLNWNLNLNTNSIAASIYVMWENEIMVQADKEFIPEDIRPFISLQMHKVLEHLKDSVINFGMAKGLSRDEFLRKNFERALVILRHYLGTDMSNWKYGQIKYKHVYMVHPLSSRYNIGPAPRGGNSETVQSTGSSPNQTHGASFSMLVDTKDWDRTLMINTPGQSGDPRSKYYDNLFQLWASDNYFPAYFTRSKIESVKAESYRMVPK